MNSKKALTNLGFVYEQQEEGFDQSRVSLWTARRGLWPIWDSFMNNNKRALTNLGFVYELQEEGFD